MSHRLVRPTLFLVLVGLVTLAFTVQAPLGRAQSSTSRHVVLVPEGNQLGLDLADKDGSQRTRVATIDMKLNHPLFGEFVALAPDGQRLLYVTADNTWLKEATFWVVQADGSGAVPIATITEGLWSAPPVWSPDSNQIAFVKKTPDSAPDAGLQIWVMGRDGSNQRMLTEGGNLRPALFERVPRGVLGWSPESAQVTFVDRYATPPYRYSVDLATGTISGSETAKDPEFAAQLAGIQSQLAALPCAVPIFNQLSYTNVMGSCGMTIRAAGCALTSTAMVFKYYGVNTDPVSLNTCMGNAACPLYWSTASSNCSQGKVSGAGFIQAFNYGVIDQDLAAGKPVIIGMSTSAGYTHFVVVTGGSGQTPGGYTINDPGDGSTNKTLANYANAGWRLETMNRYSGTPDCPQTDPDGGGISYGESRNGTINPANDYDDFYFTAAAGDIIEIRQNKNSSALDSFVYLYLGDQIIASDDDAGGSQNSFLRRTLSTAGQYRIRARAYGNSTGAYALSLTKVVVSCGGDCQGDPRQIAFGQTLPGRISDPNSETDTFFLSATADRVLSLRMNKVGTSSVDAYLELWSPAGVKVAENDDGGGGTNSWLTYRVPGNAAGVYRILAHSYRGQSGGDYEIKVDAVTGSSNLARGRSVSVSSTEFNGVEGWKATDGNVGTRWSSRFSDPQEIMVDLGASKSFNQVVLKWENAYGKRFGIYYWTGSQWQNVYWTDDGRGGTNTISFNSVTARYVKMYGIQRGTWYGYSLWEFEVYDTTGASTSGPLPPDPAKGADDNTTLPLAPADPGKDAVLSGDGEFGQEGMPLAADISSAETLSATVGTPQMVLASILSPDESGLYKLSTTDGSIRFTGEASSQIGDITAYSWRSNRSGVIGTTADFTLPASALAPGQHTIYFKAQNADGVWSDEVSVQLSVQWASTVYLPMLIR